MVVPSVENCTLTGDTVPVNDGVLLERTTCRLYQAHQLQVDRFVINGRLKASRIFRFSTSSSLISWGR